MRSLILALTFAFVLTSYALADWMDTSGRTVSTSYNVDMFDHYSGKVSLVHTDYQLLLGQNSYLSLSRKVSNIPEMRQYSLGQVLEGSNAISAYMCNALGEFVIQAPNGERVEWGLANKSDTENNVYYSKNNWRLSCSPDKPEFTVQITSPQGMSYYYLSAELSNANLGFTHAGLKYPGMIADANGNFARLSFTNNAIQLVTRFQTLRISENDMRVSGITAPIAVFQRVSSSQRRVTYVEGSRWVYKWSGSDLSEVCNPLGTCVSYQYAGFSVGSNFGGQDRRVSRRTFTIPHHGTYTVGYGYSYSSSKKEITTTATHGDHVKRYRYYHNGASNLGASTNLVPWNQGTLLEERLTDAQGNLLELVSYIYEASRTVDDPMQARVAIFPRMTRRDARRWAVEEGTNTRIWLGRVRENYSEFDRFNNPQRVQYRYPLESNSGYLFPSIYTRTTWDYTGSVHRTDRVKRQSTDGVPYFTEFSYDQRGNVTRRNVNGLSTNYTYNAHGEMTSSTDPEGNATLFSSFAFGIPRVITGPEGYRLDRTVENGFVRTETLYGGRTTETIYDALGNILEYRPAENTRAPIRYHYEFPSSGGMNIVEESGSLYKRTNMNGMGLPYSVSVSGTGSGTGTNYHFQRTMTYYDNGSLKSETTPHVAGAGTATIGTTFYDQDALGRRRSITTPEGGVIKFNYTAPFEIELTDSAGVVTVESYRPFTGFGSEKLTARWHVPGNQVPSDATVLAVSYLNNGLLDVVQIGQRRHNYNWNAQGFLASKSTPEEGLTQYEYNRNGQVIRAQSNATNPVTYRYDGLGRLLEEQFADSSANVHYTYDEINRVHKVIKGPYEWVYRFDRDGNLTSEKLTMDITIAPPSVVQTYRAYEYHPARGIPEPTLVGGKTTTIDGGLSSTSTTSKTIALRSYSGGVIANTNTVTDITVGSAVPSTNFLDWEFNYTYDALGHLATIQYPDGEIVGYLRNRLGFPTQAGSYVSQVEYHPNGGLKSLRYRNGITTQLTQNTQTGQISALRHGNFFHKQYGYVGGSHVSEIRDQLVPGRSLSMLYDQQYQLREVRQGVPGQAQSVVESFLYTPSGDLLEKNNYRGQSAERILYSYHPTTNRLMSLIYNASNRLLDYTPDGRITIYGPYDYAYAEDKNLIRFRSALGGPEYQYEYDGNGKKVRTTEDGQLSTYSIYGRAGQLLYEERPERASSNFIYLDSRMIAQRDSLYDVKYAECQHIINRAKRETVLAHLPVYVRRFDQKPVAYGECEAYATWQHNFSSSAGGWKYLPGNAVREYMVWMNHYHNKTGANMGALYDFAYYRDVKEPNGGVWRDYRASGVMRYYECYQPWRIVRYVYDQNGSVQSTQTIRSGSYNNGHSRSWNMLQKKPSFSCQTRDFDYNKISWD